MNIRILFTTVLLACALMQARAQSVAFDWVVSMGGWGDDYGNAIVTDAVGNVYVVGQFNDTADFDPGPGVSFLVSQGEFDIFVQKLDSSGNLLWAKSIGGAANEAGFHVCLDASGALFVTGGFEGATDFDPGPGTTTLISHGSADAFVLKLDTAGTFLWARSFGASAGDFGYAVTSDVSGNVYVTGYFRDTVDFDPGPGTTLLISNGSSDIFVLKLDSLGDFLWAESIGGTSYEDVYSITTDIQGNVFVTGTFNDTVDFDPGPGIFPLISNGYLDIFVLKLDASGDFLWAGSIGGSSYDVGLSIAIDGAGNVYMTGQFRDTVDFDPGPGTFYLTSTSIGIGTFSSRDLFVLKLDASGNFLWAKSMGGPSDDLGRSITVDSSGNVYVTGVFYDIADFDPGPGIWQLTSHGNDDVFVLKLDSFGNLLWAKAIGGPSLDLAFSIAADDAGHAFVTGTFEDTLYSFSGTGPVPLASHGGFDIFVFKLSPCTPSADTLNPVACISYTSPSGVNTWTVSGTYTEILSSATGCDSFLTINLTINAVDTAVSQSGTTLTATAANATFQWLDCDNGYAQIPNEIQASFTPTPQVNGNYAVEVSQNGCEDTSACYSICLPGTSTLNPEVCYDYTSPSGAYIWSESGTYTDIIPNSAGCDSIITIHLTVISVDTAVIRSGATLTATATGATFLWLDCDTGSPVQGATQATFTPQVNGIYAVQVSQNGCMDSSACISITNVGILSNDFGDALLAYPNPTTGRFTIELGKSYNGILLTLRNLHGQLLKSSLIGTESRFEIDIPGPQGIYLIEIRTADGKGAVLKVRKE